MANKKKLDTKKTIVNEIVDKFKNSSTVVFFDYQGLSVFEVTELRTKLKEVGSEVKIYKNTLMRRALDALDLDLGESSTGPNAIAFSNNIVETLKTITNYAKGHEALQLKKGIIDGEVSDTTVLQTLATIPPRDELLTMLAGGMIGLVKDLSICLHLYSEQKNI